MLVIQIPHGFLPIHSCVIEEQVFLIKWQYILSCCAFLPSCQNTPKSWEALPQGLPLLLMPVFSLPTGSIFWSARHFHVSWVQRRQISFLQVCLRQVCFSLLLSHFFHCPLLLQPVHPHAFILYQNVNRTIPVSLCRVWKLTVPKEQIFPILRKPIGPVAARSSSRIHLVPRSARVQDVMLPFKLAEDGTFH